MTASEFKAMREAVGYSVEKLARHVSVSADVARQWESGEADIPPKAIDYLKRTEASMQESVNSVVSNWANRKNRGRPVFLFAFLSDEDLWAHNPSMSGHEFAAYSKSKMHRVRDALQEHGVEVICAYLHMAKFTVWLRENRKIRSLETIREWWESEGPLQHEQTGEKESP